MSNIDRLRAARMAQIKNNPFTLTLSRPTATTNPAGTTIYGAPYNDVAAGRAARVAKKTPSVTITQYGTPEIQEDQWFLLTDYLTEPQREDRFEDDQSRQWVVQQVQPVVKYGGIVAYESQIGRTTYGP